MKVIRLIATVISVITRTPYRAFAALFPTSFALTLTLYKFSERVRSVESAGWSWTDVSHLAVLLLLTCIATLLCIVFGASWVRVRQGWRGESEAGRHRFT